MTEPDLRLFTVEDVAERLQLSRATVYQHVLSGRIESLKVGQKRRISYGQLARFIAAMESAGGTETVWGNRHKRGAAGRFDGPDAA